MREYSKIITLTQNGRGVYGLDTSIGCKSGLLENPKGCYSECYAARYAKKYGYDFSKTILRKFESDRHKQSIKNKIRKINSPFFRIGVSGDPSENWVHTFNVINDVYTDIQFNLFKERKKDVVIITKHWNELTDKQLLNLKKYNICINTSVSALDSESDIGYRLNQYKRLKPYCKSVLRIVSCDFNKNNRIGNELNGIQKELFDNENVIDTIFRCYKKHEYVTTGVINIEEVKFLGKKCNVSKHNKAVHFGRCEKCPDMCGLKG